MKEDRELQEYREILPPPDRFEDGFGWKSIIGAIFIGFIMMPASMYLNLVIGTGIGPAARWVTVILFAEVAKRAYTRLRQQEVFVLYYMAGAALSSPFSGLLWNQYLVQSEAARILGITHLIPSWVAPRLDSPSYLERSFLHRDWLVPILLLMGFELIQAVDHFGLGYALYRLTSDVEKLPFPLAPVGALGTMALTESANREETGWRWRVFSIGGMIGLLFGAIYLLIPSITGVIFSEPIRIIPIPWIELTHVTEDILPAVAVGLQLDVGLIFIGMVLPFWAVIGGLIGFVITLAVNPVLYRSGILHHWHKGMKTVETVFANNFDFYMSFGIGLGLAIAVAGMIHVIMIIRKGERISWREKLGKLFSPPPGRGDFPISIALLIYVGSTLAYIVLCNYLVPGFPIIFLVAYGFIYTPLISYISARMEGVAGQFVSLPMVREASFIMASKFFGYHGLDIWYAPIPLHNYGKATVKFREIELTGTSFRSIIKAEIFVFPVIMVASLMFSQYLWRLAPIPSVHYPYAQELWHLQALNSLLLQSSTLEEGSPFAQAFRFSYVVVGFGLGVVTYGILASLNLPIMLVYGITRGLGQTTPHGILLEVVGAMIGRYYFVKRYGLKWRQYAPVLLAGFSCGVGLMGMLGMGFTLIMKSLGRLAY